MRATRVSIAAAAALSTTCGGGGGTSPRTCGIVLSGSMAGNYKCLGGAEAVVAISGGGRHVVELFNAEDLPSVAIRLSLPGEPRAGSFTGGQSGVEGVVTANPQPPEANGPGWAATATGSDTEGTFTIVYSGVSLRGTAGGRSTYAVQGTVSASLPAIAGSGASGTVELRATF